MKKPDSAFHSFHLSPINWRPVFAASKLLAVILTAGLAVGLGCGQKTTYETKEGKVTVNQDGKQATVEATTKEGKVKFTTGGNVALPDTFPKDVPVYKGATVKMSGNQGNGLMAMFETTASLADTAKFYQDELKAQGWEIENTVNVGDATVLGAKKDQRRCNVSIAKQDKGSMITLVIEQK